ncbi:hypothetical protein NHP190003_12110 [Helicobacter sp. NHP19-003]|uniref:Autotransporter domain-containing protein n=1 Tax=Helicobacter gastrocanis TaxID=2849641 RepID=A0ABM7SD63_9HELI|nr:outer membrane beta-barrel protein [Helicobacter sp. NHP19-003]BCZ17929.1 hypothetical protein NHP190003_12110 [Helicobacter sp. NHP19-003]
MDKSRFKHGSYLLGTPGRTVRTPLLKTIKTLSLAIAGCLSLSPLDATEVEVQNMINSVSGILGGTYTTPGGTAGIYGLTSATSTSVSDIQTSPFIGSSGVINDPQITQYNLYGAGGLFGQISSSTGYDFLGNYANIYPTAQGVFNINSLLGELGSSARYAYNYRTTFSGVAADHNIGNIQSGNTSTVTNTANVANPYFSVNGSTGAVTGNLNSSLIASGKVPALADSTLTNLYTNIKTLTNQLNINTQSNTLNMSPSVINAFNTTISSTGSAFLNALAPTSTSSLSSDLNTLNSLLFAAPDSAAANKAILTSAGSGAEQYAYTHGSLQALGNLNTINSLVGGLVSTTTTGGTTTYSLNTNYTNASLALAQNVGNVNSTPMSVIQGINYIANNTLNSSSLSAVITELEKLYPSNGSLVPTEAQILSGLGSTLVDPANANAVFTAWKDIMGAQVNVKGTPTSVLAVLQTAFNSTSNATVFSDVLQLNQAVAGLQASYNTLNSNLASSANTSLANIFNNFATGTAISAPSTAFLKTLESAFGSSGAYAGLQSALGSLDKLVNTNVFTSNNTQPVASSQTANNYPNTSTPGNQTTYPGTAIAHPTSVNSSWSTQSVNNNAAYNAAFDIALGRLLAGSLNYSSLTTSLEGMLSNSSAVGNQQALLNSITSTGIANAVSNIAYNYGTGDPNNLINSQAQTLNQLQAITYSESLLNAYVNAITGPQMSGNQLNQAAALSYLDQALSAPATQGGLIATTLASVQGNLNNAINTVPLNTSTMDNLLVQSGIYSAGSTNFLNGVVASGSSTLEGLLSDWNSVQSNFAASVNLGAGGSTASTAFDGLFGGRGSVSGMVANIATFLNAAETALANGTLSFAASVNTAVPYVPDGAPAGTTLEQARLAYVIAQTIATPANINTYFSAGQWATFAPTGSPQQIAEDALVQNASTAGSLAWYNTQLATSIGTATTGDILQLVNNVVNVMSNVGHIQDTIANNSNLTNFIQAANSANTQSFLHNLDIVATTESKDFASAAASNISTALSALQSKMSTIEGQLKTWDSVKPGMTPGAPTLNLPLASMLNNASSTTSGQNLGYASASVNTMQQSLAGVWGTLNNASSLTTSNLNAAYSQVSTLGASMAKLYESNSTFFTDANLNSTAASGLQGGVVIGMGDGTTSAYFTNLTNLYTITNLIGSVVNGANNATSTNYATVFNPTDGASLVSNIATQTASLTTNLSSSADNEQLAQVLLNASSYSGSFNASPSSYAPLAQALNNAGIGATTYTNSNAQTIWTAWQNLVGANGKSGYLGTLNGALKTSQSLSTASGVAQLITDAANLQSANTALTAKVTSASGGTLTINNLNGVQFANAVNAANNLGALLQNLSTTSTAYLSDPTNASVVNAVTNVMALINALDSYNHNLGLLTSLTGSTNANTIAQDVVGYIQGNASLDNLTKSGLQSELEELQNLSNRLTYLQGLQQRVQDAMQNNPYALVMQKNAVLTSASYQGAAANLFSVLNSDGSGLLNKSVAAQYATYSSSDYSLNGNGTNLSGLSSAINTDATNIDNWNKTINNLIGSSSLLNSAAQSNPVAVANASAYLNTVSSSIYNVVGYLNGTASANQTAVASVSGDYSAVNSILTSPTAAIAKTDFQGSLSALNPTTLWDITSGNTTVLQGMQAVQWLQGAIKGGLANSVASNTATSGPYVGGYAAMTGLLSTASTGIDALVNGVMTNAGVTGYSSGITGSGTVDGSSQTAVSVISRLVSALETNNFGTYINGSSPTTFPSAHNAALLENLKTALTPIVGPVQAATLATSDTSIQPLLTAINALIKPDSSFNTLNSELNGGVVVGTTSASSIASSISAALNSALTFSNQTTAAAAALTAGLLGSTGANGTLTSAQINEMVGVVDSLNAIFNPTNITDPSASSGVGTLNADQALVQFVKDGSNTLLTGTVPTGGTAPTTLAEAMAVALGVSGGTTINASTFSTYTPQQLAAAATTVLSNAAALNATEQNNLINFALKQVVADMGKYDSALGSLTPLLTSAAGSATGLGNLLSQVAANATGVKNIANMLNPSNDQSNQGTAIKEKNGMLSSANVAQIQNLINAMTAETGRVTTLDGLIDKTGYLGQLLNQVSSNSAAETAALSKLGTQSVYTATQIQDAIANYKSAVNGGSANGDKGLIQAQVALILANPQNSAAALLSNLANSNSTTSLANTLSVLNQQVTGALNTQIGDVVGALQTMFGDLATKTSINPATVNTEINNLISTLDQLQGQVLNALAGATTTITPSQPQALFAKGGASVEGVQASYKPEALQLDVSTTSATPTTLKSILSKVNDSIAQLTALKQRLLQRSPQYAAYLNRTYAASHAPMQTMNSNGNMYGIDVQFGYKQFFGKKKRWGLRYYANFSYQHGTFMVSDASDLDNFTYGAGVDALYNFYESKDSKYTTGLFAGLMLEGSSWGVKGQSYYTNLMNYYNAHGGHAVMNTSYFQIPLNLGFRTNVNKHNGFEIGLRIPLAVNYYFKGELDGSKLDIAYKRNVSVFFNYVYNF